MSPFESVAVATRGQPAGPSVSPASSPIPRPRLRLVTRPARRLARIPFALLVATLLGVGLVGLLLLNTVIAEHSFRLHALQQRTAVLTLQEQQLQREIDALEAPGALAKRATELGMVPAGNPAFIRLSDGKILGVPTPAAAPKPVSVARPSPRPSAAPSTAPSSAPSAARSPAPAPPRGTAPARPAPSPGPAAPTGTGR